YHVAAQVARAGVDVVALVDCRPSATSPSSMELAEAAGIRLMLGQAVVDTTGQPGVAAVTVASVAPNDDLRDGAASLSAIAWDGVAASGEFNPVVDLDSQRQGRLHFDPGLGGFIPETPDMDTLHVVGAAAGTFDLSAVLQQGAEAGAEAARAAGFSI